MITTATIRQLYADDGWRADLDVPALFEGNVLPKVRPVGLLGEAGLPAVGDEVLLLVEGGQTYRWTPLTTEVTAAWLTATRRGVRTRTGDVAVVLDDADRTVRIGAASADQRVVHEGIASILSSIVDILKTLKIPVHDSTGETATLQAAVTSLESAVDAVAGYTAEGVLVPTDKPAEGGGGA